MTHQRSAAPDTGRVVAGFGHQLLVALKDGRVLGASRRGRRSDVVVGDLVNCASAGVDKLVIESVEPRSTLLYRSDDWREKSLAANIQTMVLVFAPQPSYHLQFIWRALVAADAAGVRPLVLLNKRELADATSDRDLAEIAALGVTTLSVSARGCPDVARAAVAQHCDGQASLLVGQSGMGKSTLLNLLVPDAQARTQEFSRALNVGRQTTTASRWFDFSVDGWKGQLVDTPGFQAFGLSHLDREQLLSAMPDLNRWLGHCRFSNCAHKTEPDCGVLKALHDGRLSATRHAFYLEALSQSRQ